MYARSGCWTGGSIVSKACCVAVFKRHRLTSASRGRVFGDEACYGRGSAYRPTMFGQATKCQTEIKNR